MDFITAVSFGLTCFRIGYTFSKDNNKPQNNRSTVRFSLSQLKVEIYLLLSLKDLYIVYTISKQFATIFYIIHVFNIQIVIFIYQ